jgi:BlaI family penicillinase repressor
MRPQASTLTTQELALMRIIWRREAVTVRQVYEELLEHRRIAYTSVMTVMKTLERKGYLRAMQHGRAYVYQVTTPEDHVIKGMTREFVDRVFGGSAGRLVVQLLEAKQLSKSDLREILRTTRTMT